MTRPLDFGAHDREILNEHGFSDAETAKLAEEGALVEKRR